MLRRRPSPQPVPEERPEQRAGPPDTPSFADAPHVIHLVGEAFHQDTLLDLARDQRTEEGVRRECVATLVPDPDNPYDGSSVVVFIGGEKVGYLSEGDADALTARLRSFAEANGPLRARAQIVGDGNLGGAGAQLRVNIWLPGIENIA